MHSSDQAIDELDLRRILSTYLMHLPDQHLSLLIDEIGKYSKQEGIRGRRFKVDHVMKLLSHLGESRLSI
jgi:hypothetical protein